MPAWQNQAEFAGIAQNDHDEIHNELPTGGADTSQIPRREPALKYLESLLKLKQTTRMPYDEDQQDNMITSQSSMANPTLPTPATIAVWTPQRKPQYDPNAVIQKNLQNALKLSK